MNENTSVRQKINANKKEFNKTKIKAKNSPSRWVFDNFLLTESEDAKNMPV